MQRFSMQVRRVFPVNKQDISKKGALKIFVIQEDTVIDLKIYYIGCNSITFFPSLKMEY